MIFVFVEDGTLDIIENVQQAQGAYEGIDVESDVCMFYDEDGIYLTPHFIVPNKRGKILGILPWVESGVYELVATKDSQSGHEDSIWLKLNEVSSLNPNPWFKTLEEVKDYLRAKRANFDQDA